MRPHGYCILPEEPFPVVNECSLEYTLAPGIECAAPSCTLTQDAVALPFSFVETLTAGISTEIDLSSERFNGAACALENGGEEIEIELPFPKEEVLYEMVAVEEKSENPLSIVPIGDGFFSMAVGKKKLSLSCSSIDPSKYIVLADKEIFLIKKACSTRIVKERENK